MSDRWRDAYKNKLRSADEAVALIPDGASIVQPIIAGEPPAVLGAIADAARAGTFTKLTMRALLPFSATKATVLQPDLKHVIRWESLFLGGADREAVKEGRAGFTPNFFHQVPRLLSEFIPVDVFIGTVSPMDKHGFMSLGVSVDYSTTAARVAKVVILEVNEHMPRIHGRSFIHISEATAVVEHNAPIAELPAPAMRPEDEAIGKYIADMVPDGATLQLGIGGVPNAVAQYLGSHKDLGIHSEMFTDSMVDLIEDGVANGVKKTLHPQKAVFTFAAGAERTYRFLDDNPYCESHPVSYTNNPDVIARNNQLISVNAAIEVDLTGQCCAESFGHVQFSGTGGQADFVRGAFNSPGGKSFLAFYSTAKSGEVSRIVPTLTPGAAVTTPRQDVHYLVS
ncbi:MAG: acetyl-CoA hydrolase/transferase C-terminal domain-containing protein, partial [Dehalococcoidia bacterium]